MTWMGRLRCTMPPCASSARQGPSAALGQFQRALFWGLLTLAHDAAGVHPAAACGRGCFAEG